MIPQPSLWRSRRSRPHRTSLARRRFVASMRAEIRRGRRVIKCGREQWISYDRHPVYCPKAKPQRRRAAWYGEAWREDGEKAVAERRAA